MNRVAAKVATLLFLYRKVLLRRTLELKMARTEAGTTSKRCILEEVEAFRSWKIFAKFIIFV